jgi:hypothetical protein
MKERLENQHVRNKWEILESGRARKGWQGRESRGLSAGHGGSSPFFQTRTSPQLWLGFQKIKIWSLCQSLGPKSPPLLLITRSLLVPSESPSAAGSPQDWKSWIENWGYSEMPTLLCSTCLFISAFLPLPLPLLPISPHTQQWNAHWGIKKSNLLTSLLQMVDNVIFSD